MRKIGIVRINSDDDTLIHSLKRMDGFNVVDLETVKQEEYVLDGLVIFNEDENGFGKICDWVIHSLKKQQTFIWICTKQCKPEEKEVYLQLGVNGVFSSHGKMIELVFVIKNLFFRLEPSPTVESTNINIERLQLKSSNLSVILEGKDEISLTQLEYKALDILAEKKGEAVSYEEIYHSLWPSLNGEMMGKKYRVSNIIFHLREKIGFTSIRNVRSKGYMLSV